MSGNGASDRLVISYLTLRKTVGLLGVALPLLLAIGCVTVGTCVGLQPSISDYYATEMRDVFVGTLFAIGFFLFAYKGYEPADDRAGDLAFLLAIAVALFPNSHDSGLVRTVHFTSAALLFGVLAYFSWFLFTKSAKGAPMTAAKKKRNAVFRVCAVVMVVSVALAGVYSFFLADSGLADLNPVFWLESIALWAFGWSWLVKGELILKDET